MAYVLHPEVFDDLDQIYEYIGRFNAGEMFEKLHVRSLVCVDCARHPLFQGSQPLGISKSPSLGGRIGGSGQ
jgi:hypothetical protein